MRWLFDIENPVMRLIIKIFDCMCLSVLWLACCLPVMNATFMTDVAAKGISFFADSDRDFSFYRNPGADMNLRSEKIDAELNAQSEVFHFGSLSLILLSMGKDGSRACYRGLKVRPSRSFGRTPSKPPAPVIPSAPAETENRVPGPAAAMEGVSVVTDAVLTPVRFAWTRK